MSKTALVWLLIYGAGCFLAFKNPFYGLLTYIFEYFNHPMFYWWGKGLPRYRWSFIIAIITFIAFIIKRDSLPKIDIKASPFKWLLALLATMAFVTFSSAVSAELSKKYLVEFTKLVVLYFLIVNLIRTKAQYHAFVWAIILGCFLFGWRAYQDPITSGRLEYIGGPDTRESNFLGLLMIVPLPFIGYYFFVGKRWEKILSVLAAPFILNTIIFTSSRGSFVAMLTAAVLALLLTKGKMRFKIVVGLLLGTLLFIRLTDQRFWGRINTLREVGEEDVSSDRLESWKGAWNLMKEHPLGSGGGGFDVLSPIYISAVVARHGGELRTVHNTYLLTGTDWGFPGLFFFGAFLMSTILQLHLSRRGEANNEEARRLHIESTAVEIALIGILAGSIFVNRLYAESIYWLCALAPVLRNLQSRAPNLASEPTLEKGDILSNTIMGILIRRQLKKAKCKFHEE